MWASVCQVHQSKTMSAAEYPFNIVKYIKKTCTVSIPARIANTIHDLFRNFWMLKPFFLDHIHNLLEPDSQVLKICNYETPTREIYHFTYISIQEYMNFMSSSPWSIVTISSFRCVIPTVIVAVLLAGAAGAGLFFLLYYILFLMSGLSTNFQPPSSFHFNSSLLSLDSDAHRLLSVLSRFAG